MRLLVINPNTTKDLTAKIAGLARRHAATGTEIIPATAPFGAAYISSAEESEVAIKAVLAVLKAEAGNFDAAMIASSSDSGLAEARAATRQPVSAMTEAAMLMACQLGRSFSVVTLQEGGLTLLRSLAETYGLTSRLASLRLGQHLAGGQAPDLDELKTTIIETGKAAVAEDGADTLIVGGAAVADATDELSSAIGVPVIDGISSAVKMAEALVVCAPSGR